MGNMFAGRSKEYLVKTRGILVDMLKDIDLLIDRRNPDAQKGSSGVRQAVKELMVENPQMGREEILNTLIASGFDFKGRKPSQAVNISWYYLSPSQSLRVERDIELKAIKE